MYIVLHLILTEGFSIPSVLSTSMTFASTEAICCAVAKAHTLSMPCCGASLCVAVPTVSPRHSATGLSLRTSAASVRAGVCTNGGELEKKRSRSTHPSSMAQAAVMAVHSLASYIQVVTRILQLSTLTQVWPYPSSSSAPQPSSYPPRIL